MVHQISEYLNWQLIAWISLFVFWLNYAMLPGSVFNPAKRIEEKPKTIDHAYPFKEMDLTWTRNDGVKECYIYPVQEFFNRTLPAYWLKPIFTCPVCMCSLWGTANYLTFSQHYSVISWAVTVIAAAGLTRILKNFTQ